jgi:hypothetical protein
MPSKPYPPDVLDQAFKVSDAWSKIDDQMILGPLNGEALTDELKRAHNIHSQLISLANQLKELRLQRDAVNQSVWDRVKRMRAAIKGVYGDDSAQYKLIGGTRMSERKSPKRKIAPRE